MAKCNLHEQFEWRLAAYEEGLREIRKMFWAIIAGLVLILPGQITDMYQMIQAKTAKASASTVLESPLLSETLDEVE